MKWFKENGRRGNPRRPFFVRSGQIISFPGSQLAVIWLTGSRFPVCHALVVMAKKAMAAFLLVVIAAWAEMTMAPMFAMHAGHMRPGHEMAADMPASTGHHHAGHHSIAPTQAAANQAEQGRDGRHQAQHERAMAEGRPCCPGLRKTEPVATLEMLSGVPACDDPHSCCFRQGPQSMPSPARDLQQLTQDLAPAEFIEVIPPHEKPTRAVCDSALALSPPPEVFGMTLRV